MLGLALEGGGARGSFHIGVMQACIGLGIKFDAIAGTSIGALNGAMFAQGDFEAAKEIWSGITTAELFSPEDEAFLETVRSGKFGADILITLRERVRAALVGGGVDTSRMRAVFEKHIDVDKLLASPVDFGLVTVSLPDFKPVELFKNQMERGDVLSYLMASATFPGFEQTTIGKKRFIDGGMYDNCPVNMLTRQGCDKVIAVRTLAIGVTRGVKDKSCEVVTIVPSDTLGHIMGFDPLTAKRNMKLGYYDAMRALKGLHGTRFYLSDMADDRESFTRFSIIDDGAIARAAKSVRISADGSSPRRLLFERLIPYIAGELKVKKNAGYGDILLAMLENRAARCELERMQIFDFVKFSALVRHTKPKVEAKSTLLVNNPEVAIDLLITAM